MAKSKIQQLKAKQAGRKAPARSKASRIAELWALLSDIVPEMLFHDQLWITNEAGAVLGEILPGLLVGKTAEEVNRSILVLPGTQGLLFYDDRVVRGSIWPASWKGSL